MPRRKPSRAPGRAKPTLPDDSMVIPDMEADLKAEKMELLLKDFDAQVETRIADMQKKLLDIQDSIRQLYKADLNRYSAATKNTLWNDHLKENKGAKFNMRESVAHVLSSADDVLARAGKKKGRGKGYTLTVDPPPPTTTRSTRKRAVLGNSQTLIMPPPSTAKATRSRKANLEVAATPLNQSIMGSHLAAMIVTPKFDPRTPLPPGTVKRKPRVGEIAISLTGSPLQVSPQSWISNIEMEGLDEETKKQLSFFHERVGKLLNL
ncbi:hypothetical protein SK128_026078 [Halocaridina rubra]|uniref:Borealin n=1 Tax=Halocaridina rubra TaxID=373956 RepID=A0AAN8ZY70_HALRR